MRKLGLAIALIFALSTSSCTWLKKVPQNPVVQGIIDCGEASVKSLVQGIVGRVATILATGEKDYENQLKELVKDSSAEALACAVKEVTTEFQTNVSASPAATNAGAGAKNGEKFMADMNYQFKN